MCLEHPSHNDFSNSRAEEGERVEDADLAAVLRSILVSVPQGHGRKPTERDLCKAGVSEDKDGTWNFSACDRLWPSLCACILGHAASKYGKDNKVSCNMCVVAFRKASSITEQEFGAYS